MEKLAIDKKCALKSAALKERKDIKSLSKNSYIWETYSVKEK